MTDAPTPDTAPALTTDTLPGLVQRYREAFAERSDLHLQLQRAWTREAKAGEALRAHLAWLGLDADALRGVASLHDDDIPL